MRERPAISRRCATALVGVAALALVGCEPETRVVRYDPFLARLPGAVGGEAPIGSGPVVDSLTPTPELAPEELVVRQPDGRVRLVSTQIRHVMVHTFTCLRDNQWDLLYDQVVSQRTKEHFAQEHEDPRRHILTFLKEHEDDISTLFARMPNAEKSPAVRLTRVERNMFKLALDNASTRGLRFTTLWISMERGQWKLVWVS